MGKPLPKPIEKNPRGIPKAPFLESVDEYASNVEEASALIDQLQEMLKKYRFMELATTNRMKKLQSQVPSLRETQDAIKFLKTQEEPFETQYGLNEAVYAQAEIAPPQTVWLWLGAGVMLEYPLDEAEALIAKRVGESSQTALTCEEDLEYLRENITVMEVNSARAINWQVSQRNKEAQPQPPRAPQPRPVS